MSLPSGYKRLKYIKATGTQWIDSGVVATQSIGFEIDFSTENAVSTSGHGTIFGVYTASKNRYEFGTYPDTSGGKFLYGGTINNPHLVSGSRIQISFLNNVLTTPNGSENISTQTFNTGETFAIFGRKGKNNGVLELSKTDIYALKFYDNGTLVRDFIPCQKPDSTIGLWDDVNNVFYGNAGKGTFTAGPVIAIAANESEIKKLKYIQSSGTQYIDTGIVPKNNTRVDADCDITYGTGWIMILGSYDQNKYFSWWANGATIYAYYGTRNQSVAGENGKQTLSANKNIWRAGSSVMSFSEVSFTANSSIYLFSVNNGGNYSKASMKLYSCQIYDNDVLVRDFIAAKLSDGTVGLYDKLSGLLYINAGTGMFEAGPSSLNLPVNIGGTWKDANEAFVNIGGTWKTVEAAFVNIGGTWKELG